MKCYLFSRVPRKWNNIGALNKAIFRALKPGGIYMIVAHAAKPGSGYLDTVPDAA